MKNIYLNTTKIHDNVDSTLGLAANPLIAGLEQPTIRLPQFDRPNVDGAVVPNQLYGGRLITFGGKVWADDVFTYRARRRIFEQAVSIQRDSSGTVLPILMKFTTMDDLALQVEVYTRKLDFPDQFLTHGKYKLDLFAPTLYLLSQQSHSSTIYPFNAGGFEVPFAVPLAMNANASSVNVLLNSGNVHAFPTIQINGPMTDPVLINETTDQTMNFDYELSSGEFIVIDTTTGVVVFYSELGASPLPIREYVTGEFLTLAPGDNVVKLTLGGFTTSGNVQLTWRDSYSGV